MARNTRLNWIDQYLGTVYSAIRNTGSDEAWATLVAGNGTAWDSVGTCAYSWISGANYHSNYRAVFKFSSDYVPSDREILSAKAYIAFEAAHPDYPLATASYDIVESGQGEITADLYQSLGSSAISGGKTNTQLITGSLIEFIISALEALGSASGMNIGMRMSYDLSETSPPTDVAVYARGVSALYPGLPSPEVVTVNDDVDLTYYIIENNTPYILLGYESSPLVYTMELGADENDSPIFNGMLALDGGLECECWFEYWKEGQPHNETPHEAVVDDAPDNIGYFTKTKENLAPGVWNCRAVAQNSRGAVYGEAMEFIVYSEPGGSTLARSWGYILG